MSKMLKNVLLILLVVVFSVGMMLAGSGCQEAAVETTAAAETTASIWVPTVGVAAPSAVAAAKEKDFTGQTVNVIVIQGPQVAKPFLTYAKEWEAATGATLNVIEVPYGDLYTKMTTSFATGAAAYDLLCVNPAWMGDWIPQGFLVPVPEDVKAVVDLADVLPAYSEVMLSWAGQVYALPYDADDMFLYYRSDIINPNSEYNADFKAKYGYDLDAPKTWTEYYDMAEFFNDWDWDKDGEKEYGVAESQVRKAQSLFTYYAHAGAYAKNPDSPYYFFDETMKPRINNPGFVKALDDFKKSTKFGVPGMLGFGIGEIREAFCGGKAAFAVDWGDIGTMAVDPKISKVNGLVGCCMMPGSEEVWNDTTQAFDTGKINYGPFMAFGGWSNVVASNSKVQDAAWSLAAFLGGKDQSLLNCITPESGINPGRTSIFAAIDAWVGMGMTPEFAEDYLGAIQDTIGDPNVIVDMRQPGSAEYNDVLDREISRALSGEITSQQALDNAAKEWEAITDRLDRAKQLEYYKASIGVK